MTIQDAYQILHLPYGSSKEQIQEQFSKLVLQYKPDEHPAEFMRIQEAYSVLTKGGGASSGSASVFDDSPEDFPEDSVFDEWNDMFQQLDEDYDKEEELRRKEELQKELREKEEIEKRNADAQAFLQEVLTLLALPETKKNRKKLKALLRQKSIRPCLTNTIFVSGITQHFRQNTVCREYCSTFLAAYDYLTKSKEENGTRIAMRLVFMDKKKNAPDMLPSWPRPKILLPVLLLLAFVNGFLMEMPLPDNIAVCGTLFFFLETTCFLRRKLHFRKNTAFFLCSLAVLVVLFYFVEYHSDKNSTSFSWLSVLWSYWVFFNMGTGIIVFQRFLERRGTK